MKNVMLKRISWQAIFTHSSAAGAATSDASGQMDATRDASASASFDGGAARQSIDSSLSTTATTATTTTILTASSSTPKVAKPSSARSSPPPSYLLDDDPFANLIPMNGGTRHRPSFSVGSTSSCIPRSQRPPPVHPELVPGLSLPAVPVGVQAPKSRLQDSLEAGGAHESDKGRRAKSQDGRKEAKGKRKRAKTFFVTLSAPVSPSKSLFGPKVPVPPLPTNSETISPPSSPKLPSMFGAPPPTTKAFAMTRIPRPAHQRPAFATRPSLPSLDTLAKTNIVLTKKVKKGHVGAGLPFEPWDNQAEDPATTDSISDIDRTPTSTPIFAAPVSPTRSSSSSTLSSGSLLVTPPPQHLPGQTVSLGPLVEDIETDSPRWSPPQLSPPTFKPDMSNNFESRPLMAPVALQPNTRESVLRSLEPRHEHSDTDSDGISMVPADDENEYFNGDFVGAYGISYTTVSEPEFHDSTDRSDDPESSANIEPQLRWSADDSSTESQPHSPCSSNSYAGSISDLSSGPSYPPSYAFGYGGGWSRDSMTDVSRHLSLSRSISSTSISTSSIGDDIESNLNFNHSRSRSANTSDSSQGAYNYLSLRSSALIAPSGTGNSSILHSPESEWTFFNHPSYLPDVLVGPALQKRPICPLDTSTTDQTQRIHDSELESELPITSASGQGDRADAQETTGSQQNSHAVAHDVFDESLATAEDPIPTYSPSKPDVALVLKRDQESCFSLVEPAFPLATLSDQDTHQPILAETVLCGTSSSTLNPSDHPHPETEPDELHEMNGVDRQLREKMALSGEHFHSKTSSPILSSNITSDAPRRDSRSGEEEERRRALKLLQMRNGRSFRPMGDGRTTDDPSARPMRSILRTPSAVKSFSKPQQFPSALSMSSASEGEASSDDDVPLAHRIPGALTAQQSVRKQVNEERRVAREKRRRERQVTLRPAGAALGGAESTALPSLPDLHTATSFSNVGNALTATGSIRQRSGSIHHRQRTQVLPQIPIGAHGDFGEVFKPEDLARKLQNVKMMGESFAVSSMRFQQHPHQQPQPQAQLNKLSRSASSRPSLDYPKHAITAATSVSPVPRLKTQRSFHAAEVEHRSRDGVPPQDRALPRKRSMSMSRGDWDRRGHEDSVPPLPSTTLHGRTNLDDRDRGRRFPVKSNADSKVTSPQDLHPNLDAPVAGAEDVASNKHRIFIHSLQLSHTVDIRADTSAGDLISSLEAEGALDGWAGLGGWMIWEVAHDFGMERPVRNYELLASIQASWMTEKTVNFFLLKKSLLSSCLDRSAIPSSAPSHSGWLEWEVKRGKWSKRWLHLKENCLYLSKKDGRDETLLCSLSNFDAYYITRSLRTPKPFAFTIKSTDKLSFFENTADYMHTFSCSEKDGEAWVEKILVARSYVLHQERSALFHPKATNTTNTGSATLSGSGTKKTPVTKLHQPLVNLGSDDLFEPGSLLYKK